MIRPSPSRSSSVSVASISAVTSPSTACSSEDLTLCWPLRLCSADFVRQPCRPVFIRPPGFIRHRPGTAAPNEDPREQLDQTEGTNRLSVVTCPAALVPPLTFLLFASSRAPASASSTRSAPQTSGSTSLCVDQHAHRRVEHVDARGGGVRGVLPVGGESRFPERFPGGAVAPDRAGARRRERIRLGPAPG